MAKTNKKIVITGSSGMLGRALVSCLKAKYNVVGLPHKACDVRDKKNLSKLIRLAKPQVIIHCAVLRDVDYCQKNKKEAYAVNTYGTYNIADAAYENNAVLVYISTDYVFDGKASRPYTEEDKTHPLNTYGKSKLKGEIYIRKHLKKYIIIRTTWLFGRGRRNFVDDIIKRAKTGKALSIVNDKFSTPTSVYDLAQAIKRIIDLTQNKSHRRNCYGIYHITNTGSCSWYDYAKEILRRAKIKGVTLKPIPMAGINFSAPRPVFSALDNSKFVRLTHKPLRDWKKAVREYVLLRRN